MRRWLEETHGAGFELLRHFLLRFFDSDLISASAEKRTPIIWGFALGWPFLLMFGQALFIKYRDLSRLPYPGPYRDAVRGDELWLVTLMMSVVGLLTALKWQSLFPQQRDYYALGSLPLRSRQIFAGKLAALGVVTTGLVLTLASLPSVLFPAVSGGRWTIQPLLATRVAAHAAASVAGCYFFFFALVALQGVLLNVLRPRAFARLSGTVQGAAAAAMLILIVLSFSIGPPVVRWIEQSAAGQWLPPAWFLGLYQARLGDSDPLMGALARRGELALVLAVGVALLSYLASYRRHRNVALEGAGAARDGRWSGILLDLFIPSPRQQAIMVFLWKTLTRSGHHRMMGIAYAGLGAAAVATSFFGINEIFHSAKALAAYFVFGHVILLLFLLIGFRHLFSIPAELRANWAFQITEGEGRDEWLDAVDRFVLMVGGAVMLAIPFPIEAKLIGWRAVGEAALFVVIGLVGYEWLFSEWHKLPFTCSRLPGKTPLWISFLYVLGLVTFIPIFNALMVVTLFSAAGFTVVLAIALFVWRRIHAARREAWAELRLIYDEAPDPAVHGLNLLQ
jgi:hypothetical protein